MPSFDIQCEPDMVKVKNSVENAAKEVGTRFDFKGTSAAIEIKEKEITITGDADFQLQQVLDVLMAKLAKQGVDPRFLDKGEVQKAGGDKVRQVVKVRSGIESECGAGAFDLAFRKTTLLHSDHILTAAGSVHRATSQ